jgi:hypothetical protein
MSSSEIHGKQATAESEDTDSTRATIGTPSGGRTAPDLDSHQSESARGNTAFTTERPLGVQPTPEGISHSIMAIKSDSQILAGGVAIGGQPNLPEGHAGFGDKVIGKTQKASFVLFTCYRLADFLYRSSASTPKMRSCMRKGS